MAFAFKKEETVSAGVARIIGKEAQAVLQHLTSEQDPLKERFHQARKRLKKIRAALRLVREEIGETVFQNENAAFRDVARRLSEVRDAQVLPETLDALLDHYKEAIVAARFAPAREVLHEISTSLVGKTDTRAAAREMRRAIGRIEGYGIRHDGWRAIKGGLRATYARSRGRFFAAIEAPTAIHFHEWRKSVKYLRHHIDLLSRCWEKPLEELSEQLHELSDCLGEDHDLAVLRDQLASHLAEGHVEMWQALAGLIERRQSELRAAAEPLARRLFAEKPGAFTRRVREYWDAWHEPPAPLRDSRHLAAHAKTAHPQQ